LEGNEKRVSGLEAVFAEDMTGAVMGDIPFKLSVVFGISAGLSEEGFENPESAAGSDSA
jgi:hypothetical protein